MIAKKLQGQEVRLPEDFGIVINRENLESRIDFLKKNLELCR